MVYSKKLETMKLISLSLISMLLFACSKEDEFPSSKYQIGQINLGSAYEVALHGDYAYAAYNEGVAVIDVTNPFKPAKIATIETGEAAFGILVNDSIIYVGAGGEKNLYVFNNSDPQSPSLLSAHHLSGAVSGICSNGHYLFVATQNGYLEVLNISDLSNIIKVKTVNCQGQGMDIIYHEGYIYYANSQKGLHVINVSDPLNPVIISTLAGTSGAWDIYINENRLFLAKHMYGFNVFSLDNPASPLKVFTKSNGGESYGITSTDSNLYVANLQQGVEIWDCSDVTKPVLMKVIGEYAPHDLAVRNDFLFLADQDRGFVTLKY